MRREGGVKKSENFVYVECELPLEFSARSEAKIKSRQNVSCLNGIRNEQNEGNEGKWMGLYKKILWELKKVHNSEEKVLFTVSQL